jgi:hypothetical protein
MMHFLVEHHEMPWGYGNETIVWREIIDVQGLMYEYKANLDRAARRAYMICEYQRATGKQYDGEHLEDRLEVEDNECDFTFVFSPDELEEVVEGYLWQAADGSSVSYEVRFLGMLEMDCYRGKIKFKEAI